MVYATSNKSPKALLANIRSESKTHDAKQQIKRFERDLWELSLIAPVRFKVFLILSVCLFSFFIHLGAFEVDIMEARNFVTAREMVADGSWWIPTMNGEIRIQKPPLPTWMTAIARFIGGNTDNDLIMRFPAALMATLLVLSLGYFVWIISKDEMIAFICALTLATSLVIIDMGRRGTWDIYSHGFMMMAICFLVNGLKSRSDSTFKFLISGILLALSFMSKGPVSFYSLFMPFMTGYMCAFGFSEIRKKWRQTCFTIFVFIVLSFIWPISVYVAHPELAGNVLISEMNAWVNRHVRPWYFYLHFPLYSGIWAPAVIAGLLPKYASIRVNSFTSYKFLFIWLISAIILLSLIPEKKERYLLPAAIPMAIMTGCLLRSLIERLHKRQLSDGDYRFTNFVFGLSVCISLLSPVLIYRLSVILGEVNIYRLFFWAVFFVSLSSLIFILLKNAAIYSVFIVVFLFLFY